MRSLIKICGEEIRVTGKMVRTARPESDLYHILKDPEAMVEGLRNCGTRVDLFTFTQGLPETSPKYNYPMEPVNLAVVEISSYEHWWNHQITAEARNRARQAAKRGVVLREAPFNEELVRGIWEIYNESPIRQGRPFSHFGKDFETVYKEEATFLDSSFFLGAYFEEKLIGFVKLTADPSRVQANLMNIVSMIKHREKAPTNALLAESVRTCEQRGISHLIYQMFTYGNKEWDGLMKFKQVNGFRGIDLPRYFVPITTLGWATHRLGFHHRLADRIPPPLAARLRELRASWHGQKATSVKESS